ncbi:MULTISPECIES: acetylornithine transaminase [unclassified Methanobrevibacter]|uniref:acetylornithine transaminase n=1 Tax=unclassified Methanobrevibacter TaxID=2638681 RepID=UPI0025F8C148|nr:MULTISPECIES: acetylornithine transaminase [unclassified Methanobrevibacter]MEE0941625.1 acetylornithine transaminase [Methanobrevibacter sp.]
MNTRELIKIEDDYFINTFTRQPIVLDHGEGVKVTDIDGNEYLDMFAGIAVNALGHNHPKLVKAIQEQAEKLIHISSIYYNEPALIYAKKLIEMTSFDRIFYANSGAEANEGAIKLAVKYTGKSEVISTVESFHGRTVVTLAATGHEHYHEPFKAILPKGFINVPYNDIEAIKEAITENTAAIIVEPIQGEGGVNVPDIEYLKEIEKICHENDIVFIVDEVQTGFGRCGTLFAHELFDVKPDIMTMAKGIGGGVPMGGILATEKVAGAFVPGDHGTTFGGGPLVCAAANAVLDTIVDENILDNVNEVGDYFISELKKLDKDVIAEVRGKGLMVGLELTKPGAEYVDKLREAGFLINCTADKVLRFVPPLIITKEEVDEFVKALDEIL